MRTEIFGTPFLELVFGAGAVTAVADGAAVFWALAFTLVVVFALVVFLVAMIVSSYAPR